MFPALRKGDLLILEAGPEPRRPLQREDLIIFSGIGEGDPIVHRVDALTMQGIVTRGDHCATPDPWFVQEEQILGRVGQIIRHHRILPVPRGTFYLGYARLLAALTGPARRVMQWLRPLYHACSRSWMPRRRLFPLFRPKVLCLRRSGGWEWKLFLGRREIGVLPPQAESWRVRWPYLLVVDESALPGRERPHPLSRAGA